MFTGHWCSINTGKVPQCQAVQNVTIQAFSSRPIDTDSVWIWASRCNRERVCVCVCCNSSGLSSRSHLALLYVCQLLVFMERSRARATAANRFKTSLADRPRLVDKSWTRSKTRHYSAYIADIQGCGRLLPSSQNNTNRLASRFVVAIKVSHHVIKWSFHCINNNFIRLSIDLPG